MSQERMLGVVKFWNEAKGWGAISSDVLPPGRDAWVIWSRVDITGHRELRAGQLVEFVFHAQQYESFDFVADFVRPVDKSED